MQILYSSAAVRQAIIDLYSSPRGRRVALSAFVGAEAGTYLPYARGLELFCWPRPGGTDPDALRKLIKKGAVVHFVDGLHMKLYWAEGRGAIIASANLSTNALGAGGLKEVGVRVEADAVDIVHILAGLRGRAVTSKELRQLDRLHKKYMTKNPPARHVAKSPSFREWFESPARPEWKFVYADGWARGRDAPGVKSILQERYGEKKPDSSFYDQRRDFKRGDWVLTFWLKPGRDRVTEWRSADLIVPVPRAQTNYDPECPYQIVQIWPNKHYPPPPFRIDKEFREALRKAVNTLGEGYIRGLRSAVPPKALTDAIFKNYKLAK